MVLDVLGEVKIPTLLLVSLYVRYILPLNSSARTRRRKRVFRPSWLLGLPVSRSTRSVALVISSSGVGADVVLASSVLIWVDVSWLRNFSDISKIPPQGTD